MVEQTKKAFLSQPKVFPSSKKSGKGKVSGKGGYLYWKSIGLGFKTPREAIEGEKKAQEIQKKNTTPQTLSRGGYGLLVEKNMAEKLKNRLEEAADFDTYVEPPSPPKRHETFKLPRIKRSGGMTSDTAREIAKRIDELEQQAADGSFVPEGRQDILAATLGSSTQVVFVALGLAVTLDHCHAGHQ